MRKLCKDCKLADMRMYLKEVGIHKYERVASDLKNWQCKSEELRQGKEIDGVGYFSECTCESARHFDHHCGQEAKWFEEVVNE